MSAKADLQNFEAGLSRFELWWLRRFSFRWPFRYLPIAKRWNQLVQAFIYASFNAEVYAPNNPAVTHTPLYDTIEIKPED